MMRWWGIGFCDGAVFVLMIHMEASERLVAFPMAVLSVAITLWSAWKEMAPAPAKALPPAAEILSPSIRKWQTKCTECGSRFRYQIEDCTRSYGVLDIDCPSCGHRQMHARSSAVKTETP